MSGKRNWLVNILFFAAIAANSSISHAKAPKKEDLELEACKSKEKKKRTKIYLSLTGGALAGKIQLRELKRIEKLLSEHEGRPVKIAELVDVIVGSSIGAIIGGYLSLPKESAPEQAKYTVEEIETILDQITTRFSFYRAMIRWTVFGYNIFSELAGSNLSDAVIPLYIRSKDVRSKNWWEYVTFSSEKAKLSKSYDLPLWQALRASSSLWFNQHLEFNNKTATGNYFTDAGLHWGNDPVETAEELALKNIKEGEHIVIYSLGTGFNGGGEQSKIKELTDNITVVEIHPDFSERDKSSRFIRPTLNLVKNFFPLDVALTDINLRALLPGYIPSFERKAEEIISEKYFGRMKDDFLRVARAQAPSS